MRLTPRIRRIAIVRQCAFCSLHPTSPSLSRPPVPAIASSFPIASSGTSTTSSRTGTTGRRVQPARAGRRALCRAEGHAVAGSRAAARSVQAVGGARTAGVSGLVLPVAPLRRRPARQHHQRAPPAGAAAVRALEAGRVLVQSRAAQHPARDRARLDGVGRGAAAVQVRDRGSLPPAGTRARRGRRAADVAGQPAVVGAERVVLRAVHRRRQVSDGDALDRRGGGRSRTVSTGRFSRRGASRRTAPPRSRRCTTPTSRRSTPTPRSTTASASGTGSRRAPAATRARSRRRSTATTSPPTSSRT